jgi:hypothetical protein
MSVYPPRKKKGGNLAAESELSRCGARAPQGMPQCCRYSAGDLGGLPRKPPPSDGSATTHKGARTRTLTAPPGTAPRRCATTRRPERSTDHAAPAEQRHRRWLVLPRVEQLSAGPQRAELVGLLFVKNVRFPPKSPVGPSATVKTARFLE